MPRFISEATQTTFQLHDLSCEERDLLDQLDLARSPGLVDSRLERGVHAKDHEPALARNRLDPVVLVTLRRLGAEVDEMV